MKLLVIICAIVAFTSAEYMIKTPEEFQRYRSECVADLKVPTDHVELFKKWEYPNDSVTQCYLKCVLIKFGLFDDQAGFNIVNVHRQLTGGDRASVDNDPKLRSIIQSCIEPNEKDTNGCEWAYRGATCFFKRNLKLVQQSVAPPTA